MKSIRYEGLDELRALAAMIVVPGHIEQFKQLFGMPYYYWFPIPGKLGVVLFFVLSGFLITTLLLKEKASTENIQLKKFYFRRMLRIWPLYFLIMGISILVFNQLDLLQVPAESQRVVDSFDVTSVILIIAILPNLLLHPVAPIPYAGHTWSIGIEEQFYLLQPFLIRFLRSYKAQILLLIVIVFSEELINYFMGNITSKRLQIAVSQLSYFGCIAIGCISAILYIHQRRITKLLVHNKFVQVCAYILFIYLLVAIYKAKNENIVDFRYHAIIFSILILNIATNPLSVIKIKNRTLAYFGKISYGIYMYHPICIGLAIALTKHLASSSSSAVSLNIQVYLLTLILVFSISALSFKYYEGYFLRLKKRYQA